LWGFSFTVYFKLISNKKRKGIQMKYVRVTYQGLSCCPSSFQGCKTKNKEEKESTNIGKNQEIGSGQKD
jgi:GTP cyclohydrolase FolE2